MNKVKFLYNYILFAISLVLLSCDNEYNIAGSQEEIYQLPNPNFCIIDTLDLNLYLNNNIEIYGFEFDKNGNMLVLSNQGILKRSSSNFENIGNYIGPITFDINGNLWINTTDHIVLLDSNYNLINKFDNDSLFDGAVISKVYIDKNNNTYVSSFDNLFRYQNGKWNIVLNYEKLLGERGFSIGRTYNIIASQDNILWIGTQIGLLKYENDNSWELYNTLNSDLKDNNIHKLFIDNKDRKWLLTGSGIEMYDELKWYLYDDKMDQLDVKDNMIFTGYFSTYDRYYNNNTWINLMDKCVDKILYINHARFDNMDSLWVSDRDYIYKLNVSF